MMSSKNPMLDVDDGDEMKKRGSKGGGSTQLIHICLPTLTRLFRHRSSTAKVAFHDIKDPKPKVPTDIVHNGKRLEDIQR
jgi:hypothetical protein